MTEVKNTNYVTIQGFMRNELDLRGNELMVYAVIYGFSQTNGGMFAGSAQYIAEWLGSTRRTVMSILNSLVEKNLIIKHKKTVGNNITICDYEINKEMLSEKFSHPMKNFPGGYEKISQGYEKISPHIIEDNTSSNSNELVYTCKQKNVFIKPTISELNDYIKEIGAEINAEKFYDYYEAKGWLVSGSAKMKDWKATVRNWKRREDERKKEEEKKNEPKPYNAYGY